VNDDLTESYAYCRRVARRSGSSFYYSFLLLPRPERRAMCALYAFLRRTDDLSDSDEAVEQRRTALAAWRRALLEAVERQTTNDPVLRAVAHTMTTFRVPIEHLTAAIDGVEMDLDIHRYDTFKQLEGYCQLVASAVGLACLRIWGCERPEAVEPARRCGVAFQMTNILRDLKEDAARGRVYLPRADMERFDYTAEDLLAGVCDERFRALMHFEIDRTERLYLQAEELERWLAPQRRRVFGSMMAMYHTLLAEIKRLDGDVLSYRVRLGGWQKMRIAARWLLLPSPARAAAGIGLP
jgi:15-cis-phytoene synthase